jgi:hypothetical protein
MVICKQSVCMLCLLIIALSHQINMIQTTDVRSIRVLLYGLKTESFKTCYVSRFEIGCEEKACINKSDLIGFFIFIFFWTL